MININLIAQGTFSVHVEKVEWSQDGEHQLLHVMLRNTGDYIGYPVVQVEVDGKIVANKKREFTTYGIAKDMTDTYRLETDLEEMPKDSSCTIILNEGKNPTPISEKKSKLVK